MKKEFRSRLSEWPIDLKCEIGEIPLQKGMRPTSRKEAVINALNKYGLTYTEVGTGTNRFIVRYDGYAVKIALDREGIADNMQEFAISDMLSPHVANAYEISKGGHLLVADYYPAFTSYSEMWAHASTIRRILGNWSQRCLLGDVGLNQYNYANWGMSPEGEPKCIDYAYVFPAGLEMFKCICGNTAMVMDGNYSEYKCSKCGRKYQDRELRARISKEERMRLFDNVSGILMSHPVEEHDIDDKYIVYKREPDEPDLYRSSMTAVDHMFGMETESWGR